MSCIDMAAMGKRIKQQRNALGLTQQDIYDKLNISQNHYSRIENGHIGMSFEILVQLSEILNISIDYILTGKLRDSECPDFAAKYSGLSDKQKQFIAKQMDFLKEIDLK